MVSANKSWLMDLETSDANLLEVWNVRPDRWGEAIFGVGICDGQEFIGGWRRDETGVDGPTMIWAERAPFEALTSWTEEAREREEKAWRKLVHRMHERYLGQQNAAYRHSEINMGWRATGRSSKSDSAAATFPRR